MKLSIIIPVVNEGENLKKLLPYLQSNAGNYLHEIIISDGGSKDDTKATCEAYGVIFISNNQKGRAVQMNEGAKYSTGDVLYFLHADSIPPKYFSNEINVQIANGINAGCFKMSFDWRHWLLRFSGWLTQFNNKWCRGGDQSLFVSKAIFDQIGGYNEKLIIYEDNEILKRIRKISKFKVIKKTLVTSSRRYRDNGVYRLQFLFFTIHLMFRMGVNHDRILNFYKKYVR